MPPLAEAGFVTQDGKPDWASLEQYGPTLKVIVEYRESETASASKAETVYALIDTGACESCIDSQLVQRLGLPVVDVRQIAGVSGAKSHFVHMAHIIAPNLDITQYGAFTAVELAAGGQPHAVLLGRDFLRNTIMIYDGMRAQVTLASHKLVSSSP